MISDRIYDDIPPQMEILNMVIPNVLFDVTHRKHSIFTKHRLRQYVDQS